MSDGGPKRPAAFGEGTVPVSAYPIHLQRRAHFFFFYQKKQRETETVKPKSLDSRVRKASNPFLSSDFNAKTTTTPSKPKSVSSKPFNVRQQLSGFTDFISTEPEGPKEVTETPIKAFRTLKPLSHVTITPDKATRDDITRPVAQREVAPRGEATPLKARIRPPDFFSKDSPSTSRTVTPLKALIRPALQLEELEETGRDVEWKKLPAPNFDITSKDKAKMMTVTSLDLPAMDIRADVEPVGDVLELQRGLLVSPEKGSKRRERFLLYVVGMLR